MKKNKTILLVDDEPDIHHIIKISLSKSIGTSYIFESAMNGKEAIEKYQQLSEKKQQPLLVLMDLKMPVMDGIEAIEKILEKYPNTNIYAFTAYDKTAMGKKAMEIGAKGIIDKSLSYADIITQIKKIIKQIE
jgi:two-component system, response regulator YesN